MPRGRPKGIPKTGGRKPGSPNKRTVEVKAALQSAFVELGGVPSLVKWGKKNPTEFYRIWSKLVPLEVKNPDGETFRTQIVEELTDAPHEDPHRNGKAPFQTA